MMIRAILVCCCLINLPAFASSDAGVKQKRLRLYVQASLGAGLSTKYVDLNNLKYRLMQAEYLGFGKGYCFTPSLNVALRILGEQILPYEISDDAKTVQELIQKVTKGGRRIGISAPPRSHPPYTLTQSKTDLICENYDYTKDEIADLIGKKLDPVFEDIEEQ